jgi:cupin fold WbuC family metalloprotein
MGSPVQLIQQTLLDSVLVSAKESPRKRMNHNFHSSAEDNPHRFLNAICRGSYCPPHRHITPPKAESFLVLQGQLAFVLFDDMGDIAQVHRLGENGLFGVDVAPGYFHSVVALSETVVCYEVKPGPYSPILDKDFAPWAPRENAANAPEYLKKLEQRILAFST